MKDKDDFKFLNTHPQLIPLPPGLKVRHEFLSEHSVLYGEAIRNGLLLKALKEKQGEVAMQALHSYFQDAYDLKQENYERDCQYLAIAIQTAHDAHDHLLRGYLTKREQVNLDMISDVATTRDPVRLIQLTAVAVGVAARYPHDVLSGRIAFEGGRVLRLAQLEFEASLHGLSKENLTDKMRLFTAKLEEVFFARQQSERFLIEADLDPRNTYRVIRHPRIRKKNESIGERVNGYERTTFPLDVRFVEAFNRKIPVFYDTRVKDFLSLKLIRKCERDPRALHDLCGAKFVFFAEKDLKDAVHTLRKALVRFPGCVFGEASSLERSGVLDKENTSSADEFRAWKFNILFLGRYFELQFMLIEDWVNEWASHGKENHDLYKLRAFLESLFPRLWPQVIYDIDWSDSTLCHRLHESMLHRIGKDTGIV
ncbi:hypothetical protein IT408_00205 [Candidatus Uhrbacteria bacterium]|nr:hypothetical protein [Candidatus Uhrbacteria bacterium]